MSETNKLQVQPAEMLPDKIGNLLKHGDGKGWFDGPGNTLLTAIDLAAMLNFYFLSTDRKQWEDTLESTVTRTVAMLNDTLEILKNQVQEIERENLLFHFGHPNSEAAATS